jgi:hypothetical protein
MFYMPTEKQIRDFKYWLQSTPPDEWPSPRKGTTLRMNAVTGAFDVMPDQLSRKRVGRKSRMARDAEPTKQFRQEQLAGEDDDFPYSLAHPELAEYLRQKTDWSSEDIEEACRIAAEAKDMSCDEPNPFPGRPRPGGTMDPIERDEELIRESPARIGARSERAVPEHFQSSRGGATDARALAMDAASRIKSDYVPAMDSATRDARMLNHMRGKMDAYTHAAYMAQTAKGFAAKWPDAARIKQA